MFRKLKKLFSAQYNHFHPSIHNIVKYPCKKDICQKIFFYAGEIKKIFSAQYSHFRPSIHNLVKYPCKKYFIFQEKITSSLFAPSSLFFQSGGAFPRKLSPGDLLSLRSSDF